MMKTDNRKIALVGTGMVGMSFAYSLLNQSVCDELVLIDADKKRAQGEAMDLNHGLAFSPANMKIYAEAIPTVRTRISSRSAPASPRSQAKPAWIF